MSLLQTLPLDAWAIVFRYFDASTLTLQFDVLFKAGVFQRVARLDTFWSIMSKLELANPPYEPPAFQGFPNGLMYRTCQTTLMEMGIPERRAACIAGDVQGDLELAIQILGWNA